MRFFLLAVCLIACLPVGAEELRYFRSDGRSVAIEPVAWRGGLAFFVPGRTRPVELTEQLIVRPVDPAGLDARTLARFELEVVEPLKGLTPTWVLRARGPAAAVRACRSLVEAGLVVWAVPDFRVPVELLHIPADPFYADQWHLADADGQDIAVEGAWDLTTGDPQVVIAVADTGVDSAHPDLDPARMVPGRNTVADRADAFPTNLAIDHHGTACMGLAVASMDNDTGVAGVCPSCSWMPVRVFGDGAIMQLSALGEGIIWAADNGAWVISNSWGIGQELIDAGVDVVPVQEAVRYATTTGRGGLGCVVLFAAGNGDSELNAMPIGPDELPAMDETLAVGGSDHLGAVAKYSDYGPYVSVLAPTWSGYSNDPRVTTTDVSGDGGANKGGENFLTDPGGDDYPSGRPEPDGAGDYTQYFSGTSAATPIAAGVAGLVLSADPELTWQQVKALLQDTATKIGTQVEAPRVAADYDADGHDDFYGFGRVHALRAVAVALFGLTQPDQSPCALDINCAGECLADPVAGDGPSCATACATLADCQADQDCLEGHCYPAEPDGDAEIVIKGGCGCGVTPVDRGPAVLGLLGWLLVAIGRALRLRI